MSLKVGLVVALISIANFAHTHTVIPLVILRLDFLLIGVHHHVLLLDD